MEREILNLEITENSNGKGLCFKRGEQKSLLITAKFKKQLETFPKNVAQLIKIMNDNPENVSYLEAISLGGDKETANFVIWLSQNFYGEFEIYDEEGLLDWKISNQGALGLLKSNTIKIVRYYYDLTMEIDSSFSVEQIKKRSRNYFKNFEKTKARWKRFSRIKN